MQGTLMPESAPKRPDSPRLDSPDPSLDAMEVFLDLLKANSPALLNPKLSKKLRANQVLLQPEGAPPFDRRNPPLPPSVNTDTPTGLLQALPKCVDDLPVFGELAAWITRPSRRLQILTVAPVKVYWPRSRGIHLWTRQRKTSLVQALLRRERVRQLRTLSRGGPSRGLLLENDRCLPLKCRLKFWTSGPGHRNPAYANGPTNYDTNGSLHGTLDSLGYSAVVVLDNPDPPDDGEEVAQDTILDNITETESTYLSQRPFATPMKTGRPDPREAMSHSLAKYQLSQPQILLMETLPMGSSTLWGLGQIWGKLLRGVRWSIGDNTRVQFWHDTWLHSDVRLGQACTDITIPERQTTSLLRLAAQLPPQSNGRDLLYWGFSANRSFSTTSAYSSLVAPVAVGTTRLWKLVWKWDDPQRIRQFLWLVAKGRLFTNSERFRRHVAPSPGCALCGGPEESLLHALRDCDGANQIWRSFVPGGDFSTFCSMSLEDWLISHLSALGLYGFEIWPCVFGIVMWRIFHARNSFIFNNEAVDVVRRAHEIRMHMRNIFMALAHASQCGIPFHDDLNKFQPLNVGSDATY
ncbi:Unknown protein [Striga hermonthica]|uniref:Reverse transcriptase zinc-binding domain-containing protein n=1 Tax=Striga hermonthica TaxID=68872 RepID=A0A9N7N224_STRHE|nr:Unknown protein [Striga hermonthica]